MIEKVIKVMEKDNLKLLEMFFQKHDRKKVFKDYIEDFDYQQLVSLFIEDSILDFMIQLKQLHQNELLMFSFLILCWVIVSLLQLVF
jgi:hypothetical protein